MEAHIESVMDMRLTAGSAIEEEQPDALPSSRVTAVADPYLLEVLQVDGIALQGTSRQREYEIPDHEWEELLDIVEHLSGDRHRDEVQIDILTVSRAAVFLVSSPLQEYIDGACSISCPLWPMTERGASFLKQLSLADRAEQRELITGWRQHSRHAPYAVVVATSDPSSRMDWREIMIWYLLDGTIFFVGSTAEQGPLDIAVVTNSSWHGGTSHHSFSTPSRFQESRIIMGLS